MGVENEASSAKHFSQGLTKQLICKTLGVGNFVFSTTEERLGRRRPLTANSAMTREARQTRHTSTKQTVVGKLFKASEDSFDDVKAISGYLTRRRSYTLTWGEEDDIRPSKEETGNSARFVRSGAIMTETVDITLITFRTFIYAYVLETVVRG